MTQPDDESLHHHVSQVPNINSLALQQQQLETALANFPSNMDKNERWKAIAATVDGKNKKDCIVRFKFLREQVKLRKGNT